MPSQLGLLRSTSTTDCDVNFSSREFIGYFDHVGWGLRLMTDTMLTLRIDRERMAERAGSNWSTASDLADCIVKLSGLDFRRAHHIVATLVRQSEAANMRPADVGSSELDRAAEKAIGRKLELDDKIVRDALDPVRFVNTRTSEGSVGPAHVLSCFNGRAVTLSRRALGLTRRKPASPRRAPCSTRPSRRCWKPKDAPSIVPDLPKTDPDEVVAATDSGVEKRYWFEAAGPPPRDTSRRPHG